MVDDELDLRFVLRLALESRGHDVTEATDGEHAIELLTSCPAPPHVIVTDLHMPAMDGRALVTRLRSEPPTAEIPIVLWSANPVDDLAVDAVVAKGWVGEVVASIEGLLGGDTCSD